MSGYDWMKKHISGIIRAEYKGDVVYHAYILTLPLLFVFIVLKYCIVLMSFVYYRGYGFAFFRPPPEVLSYVDSFVATYITAVILLVAMKMERILYREDEARKRQEIDDEIARRNNEREAVE